MCSLKPVLHGCSTLQCRYEGAFTYMINKGLTSSSQYPYVASRSTCPAGLTTVSRLASYSTVAANAQTMLQALKNGPIAVAVTADNNWCARSCCGPPLIVRSAQCSCPAQGCATAHISG